MNVAFFINPLAGYGGKINNKGSDNLRLNNINDSVSLKIGEYFLKNIDKNNVNFIVPEGYMGSYLMDKLKIKCEITYKPDDPSTKNDTINFINSINNIDLLCFVGGDGTARDIISTKKDFLTLGIPAGVKMYSSVFAINVDHAIYLFNKLINNDIKTEYNNVYDIDEEKFRSGILDIKFYGKMKIPLSDDIVNSSKAEYNDSSIYDISEYIIENMDKDTYYLIGPGTTCKNIEYNLGFKTNILGFDLIKNKKLLLYDMDENSIYNNIINKKVKLIITIIGGQGFLLGRGNKQLSSRVIKNIGFKNIMVISSHEKLMDLKNLYVDISHKDFEIPEYIKVLTGYNTYKIMKIIY